MGYFNVPPLTGGEKAYIKAVGRIAPVCYCAKECKHADCAEVRRYYEIGCFYCGEGFIAGQTAYIVAAPNPGEVYQDLVWVHATCLMEEKDNK